MPISVFRINSCGLSKISYGSPQLKLKKTLVTTADGGPDENPRYLKMIKVGIYHFAEHNLGDAFFIATNAA